MTVRGPKDPDKLGVTLMHEHLFIQSAARKTYAPDDNTPATEVERWYEKLTLENLHIARSRKHTIADNLSLASLAAALAEVTEFRTYGGSTIVDLTSIGIRRDPMALVRVSDATGLNIVMGASWYTKQTHPPAMDERTVEDLADEIVRDITVGVGDTGVRSGIIGVNPSFVLSTNLELGISFYIPFSHSLIAPQLTERRRIPLSHSSSYRALAKLSS